MVQKYSKIFPQISHLDDEQLFEHFATHMIHNIAYVIVKSTDKIKIAKLKKLLSMIEKYGENVDLKDLEAKGFNEEAFYNELCKILQ